VTKTRITRMIVWRCPRCGESLTTFVKTSARPVCLKCGRRMVEVEDGKNQKRN